MNRATKLSRVFLITGCSTGIGRSMATALAAAGHVVYAGARNIQALESQRSETFIPVVLDVNDETQIDTAIDMITSVSGRLDVLVNNAGYGAMGPLVEMPMDQLKAQFQTNVFAPLLMTQKCLHLLRCSKGAQLVNIGSAAGVTPVPFSGAYCASKSALHTLTDVLRMELKSFDIHCMTVYPGAVSSEFGSNANNRLSETLQKDSLYKRVVTDIEARAKVSSGSPTTADMFARALIAEILSAAPAANKRIGYGSLLMPLTKILLPTRVREHLLRKKFHLTTI